MHGLTGPWMTEEATGVGIHQLLADVLVGGGRMHKHMVATNYRYPLKRFAYEGDLNNRIMYDISHQR